MIVLVGASASGKTEIAKIMVHQYGYKKSITTTTRPPRMHEMDGVDYHFVNQASFEALENKDAFIEVTHYQHASYGLQKKDAKINGITILDPNGANHLYQLLKNQVFIVYVYASKETRFERMQTRSDDPAIIQSRIDSDDQTFDPKNIEHIHLMISNENTSLLTKAAHIHTSYQAFIKGAL